MIYSLNIKLSFLIPISVIPAQTEISGDKLPPSPFVLSVGTNGEGVGKVITYGHSYSNNVLGAL